MRLHTWQDGDQGEVEDIFKTLRDAKKDDNSAIVRLKDDAEYIAFMKAANEHVRTAQGTAQMVAGAVVPVWAVAMVFPDGPGWRILLQWQPIQAQLQPAGMGMNGKGKGLRGLKG